MEVASKRQDKQDKWLKKFHQSTEASRETHYNIQGLEGKVKTLANEVEGQANNKKFKECKIIYSENRLPLYTPFYYSPEEIEYFFANSGFYDNEEQETDDSRMAAAVAALEATLKKKREKPKKVKQNVNYYVDPYEPPLPFPKRLEHHAEEALDIRMPIILRRPLLAIAHAQVDIFRKTISLEVGSEKLIFKMRSSFTTNFESVRSIKSKTFIEDDNLKEIDYDLFLYDSESLCKMIGERIIKDYWRERFGGEEDDLEEYLEDPEECGEDKANTMSGVIHDKLNNDWFNNTSKDEDNLEGILDYLKPRSYDGLIDLDDEAYNKRRCRLLGMTYEEPNPILIEKAKVTRYTVGLRETHTKVKVLGVEKIPRTRDNVAALRARLIKNGPRRK
nr:hypothetical protein [Tanacetum cinerariifolium]GEW92327.1 hypothetical protein [Tanacetum cinerariifolium]